jgi:Na+-driven multidrug efflux pump
MAEQTLAHPVPAPDPTTHRRILSLALPMMAAEIVGVLVPIGVMVLMGRMVGDEALYVRSLFVPMENLFIAVQAAFGITTQVVAALNRGEGRREDVMSTVASMARTWLVVGLVTCVLFFASAAALAGLLGVTDAARDDFMAFLRWMSLAHLTLLGPMLAAAALRGYGHARAGALVTLTSAGVELGGVALLGLGFGWGIAGVPVAVGAAGLVGTVLGLVMLRRTGLWRPGDSLAWQPGTFGHLGQVGVPVAATYVVIFGSTLALEWVLSPFGDKVISGFAGASVLQVLVIMPGIVLGSAIAIVMNEQRGAGRRTLFAGTLKGGLQIAVGLYTVVALAAWLGRDVLAHLITGNPEIAAETSAYLTVVGPTYLFMGLVLTSLTLLEQIGGGPLALTLNAGYFVGIVVVGGWFARSMGESAGLYRTIAAFNLGGLVAVAITILFVRRLSR